MYKQAIKRGKYYHARIRIHPNDEMFQQSLRTTDKEVATKRLNELARQMERETEGLATPTKMKQAAQLPLGKHLRQYLVAREADWSSEKHAQTSRDRIKKLFKECGWKHLKDIDAVSFMEWRSGQSLKPKTLNEYLSVLNQFLKWMQENEFIEINPMRNVKRIPIRGRTAFHRRALSIAEIEKLLKVVKKKPTRRAAYLSAIYTGLRRAELEALEWGDVMTEAESPYLAVRASTTKNGKDSNIPLHPTLQKTLQKLKPKNAKPTDRVLEVPPIEEYRKDLKEADIVYMSAGS